jgi:hypothetical protein
MDKCNRCKSQRTSGGFLWCVTCRIEGAARVAARRAGFLADELCSECGDEFGELTYGGISIRNCKHHLEYQRLQNEARRHNARKRGLCVWCRAPAQKADKISPLGYRHRQYCKLHEERMRDFREGAHGKGTAPMKRAA